MNNFFRIVSGGKSIFAVLIVAACTFMPAQLRGQQVATPDETAVAKTFTPERVPSQRRHVSFPTTSDDSSEAERSAPATSGYKWTGFYIGGHGGYNWGNADTSFQALPSPGTFFNLADTTLRPHPKGFAGGIQGGYNWQRNHLFVGGEADFSWTDMDETVTLTPIPQNNGTPFPGAGFLRAGQKTNWINSYRLRGGVAIDRVLLYGTIGLALGNVHYTANSDFRPVGTEQYIADFSRTRAGVIAGPGAEIGILKHISVKAEYLFYDLSKAGFVANPSIPFPPGFPNFQVQYRWKTQANTFNAGVNYRF